MNTKVWIDEWKLSDSQIPTQFWLHVINQWSHNNLDTAAVLWAVVTKQRVECQVVDVVLEQINHQRYCLSCVCGGYTHTCVSFRPLYILEFNS